MIVLSAPSFDRAYNKLTDENKKRVDSALQLFMIDPFDRRLWNHKLTGSKSGLRSFSAGYDLRILYKEQQGHAIVLLIKVGRHHEVY